MKAYIDSDILISHLRGNKKALNFLTKMKKNAKYELWIGAMQRAEIIFFMRENEEKNTMAFLSQFKTAAVSENIIDKAGKIYRAWFPSHGIDINDAILAATAQETGGIIFCQNIKHYSMPDILAQKAWK